MLSYFAPPCHGDVDIPTSQSHQTPSQPTISLTPLSVANAWLPANEPPSNAALQLLTAAHHGLHQDSAL